MIAIGECSFLLRYCSAITWDLISIVYVFLRACWWSCQSDTWIPWAVRSLYAALCCCCCPPSLPSTIFTIFVLAKSALSPSLKAFHSSFQLIPWERSSFCTSNQPFWIAHWPSSAIPLTPRSVWPSFYSAHRAQNNPSPSVLRSHSPCISYARAL